MNEFRINGNLVWIKLTQGQETCIDLVDLPLVREYRWCAHRKKNGKFYAINGASSIQLHQFLNDLKRVDHIDGNGLNNSRSNFRFCTQKQNCANRVVSRKSKSGLKGVRLHKGGLWNAYIGSGKSLGYFKTSKEAALAYNAAAVLKYGEFARINTIT